MGKVKETASTWPPVSQDPATFNTQMPSPNPQYFAPSSNSYPFQNLATSDPQSLKASYDLVMKELEQELFTRSNTPNSNAGLNQMIISQYLALLEQQNQLAQNFSYSAPVSQQSMQVMDTEMFTSPPSTPSTCSSISTPRSSASSTPVSSPPMSPRSSFSMARPPIHIQQIALQAQQNQILMTPSVHQQQTVQLPDDSPDQFSQDSHLLNPLTPLSSGGFIYNFPGIPGSPQPFSPFMPVQTQSFTSTINPVSPAIAVKQEKLEKYRQKRTKRNYNRPIDQARRERAQTQIRDSQGHFINEKIQIKTDLNEVKNKLAASEEESKILKDKLANMEQELARLRQKAEEANASQQAMIEHLINQQQMNKKLISENRLLWTTVPTNEVFSTLNKPTQGNSFVSAFKEKIDFANIELNWTDSSIL